uniref:Uncharacterized protein n=1 Tax=Oryza sativa subsp. japonica TaxID=39947 RepID=Q6Z9Y4_ORYSJ|nr:hypothetical protein [Oryza sativa Japonica Group]BAD05459.1 hypothetical protein [Oryza sativa Japonica Group]
MSRTRLVYEWAKNSELTRQTGPQFTSLQRRTTEEATSQTMGWLGQPQVQPNLVVRPDPPHRRWKQGFFWTVWISSQ